MHAPHIRLTPNPTPTGLLLLSRLMSWLMILGRSPSGGLHGDDALA